MRYLTKGRVRGTRENKSNEETKGRLRVTGRVTERVRVRMSRSNREGKSNRIK